MTWETELLRLFDDLEQQAAGLALEARDAEVADLGRDEYASVDLLSRLHASTGTEVSLLTSAGSVHGRLGRVGDGWCLVVDGQGETVVRLASVRRVQGLGRRSDPEEVRPVTARLGLASVLRALAVEAVPVAVWDVTGQVVRGTPVRVGRDFLELDADGGGVVVPFDAVALVRRR